MQTRTWRAVMWSAALLLISCGGGDDNAAPVSPAPVTPPSSPPTPTAAPAAPSVTLGYGVKQLQFSWATVSGATHYRLLERPQAAGAFAQVGADVVGNSVSHDIAVHLRVNAAYQVEACNSGGCTASNPIAVAANLSPAIGYFKASNTGANDGFGYQVALSADGTTLAVSASGEASGATGINGNQADESAGGAGAVYVFVRNAGTWAQQAYIKPSNTEAGDQFGHALALSADGSTLAVGAELEDSNAVGINGPQIDNGALNSGAVYVFVRAAGAWSQQAYIKASNSEAGDQFGRAIALSGDGATLVAGANLESSSATGVNGDQSSNTASQSGAAYVFTRAGSAWSQQAYIKASNTAATDFFGWSVALNGNGSTLAVGATLRSSAAGAVYVFTRTGNDWAQQAYVTASNNESGDQFGHVVALSDDGATLAVSAIGEDSNATGIGGSQGNNAASNSGAAYVFTRDNGAWSQQAYLKASNNETLDFFGWSAALSADGTTLAIGSPSEASNATGVDGAQADNSLSAGGAAYVFTRTAGTWSQQAYVKPSNTNVLLRFGWSASLTADGTALAVGGVTESSAATGINGNQSSLTAPFAGAAYLY